MDKECTICKMLLNNSCEKYNLKIVCTKYTNIPMLMYIENIIESTLISSNFDVCLNCYDLVNELDQIQQRYEAIREKLTSYLGCQKSNGINHGDISEIELETRTKCKTELTSVDNRGLNKTSSVRLIKPRSSEHSKQYGCSLCFKTFSSKHGITLHVRKKHTSDFPEMVNITNSSVKIEICDEEISDRSNIFLPNETGKLLTTTDKIITDFVGVNDGETIPSCIDNKETEETKNVLSDLLAVKPCIEDANLSIEVSGRKHKKKKNLDTLKPYKCLQCSKAFKTQGELRSHMSAHNNVRPFICEVCGQGYKNKSALDIHVGMHNGINPFTCIFCNKSFTQKGALRRHMPIHTGEAPYQCDLCGKRFVHHTSFHIHQLSHTGQKQYKCNICGLALLSGSHLKRHMRVHTGEKNYACSVCGKRFAERYNLASHQKLHDNPGSGKNGRKNHRCQICGSSYDKRMKLEEHLAKDHQKILDTSVINYQPDMKIEETNFKIEITRPD